MDLAKYRNLFIEEGREHLAELSSALLALEKQPDDKASIDLAFRMAHSIKGMAASLGFDPITELAHRLEDRLSGCRSASRVEPNATGLLFEGLEGLEHMVASVAAGADPSPAEPALLARLGASAEPAATPAAPPKKAPRRP